MRRGFTLLACTLILCAAVETAASAAERVALVIGNGAYVNVPNLTNPVNDATDMTQMLRRIGFAIRFAGLPAISVGPSISHPMVDGSSPARCSRSGTSTPGR